MIPDRYEAPPGNPETSDPTDDVVGITTDDGAVVLYEFDRPTTWIKSSAAIPISEPA